MGNPKKIELGKAQIFAEGEDCYFFCIWAYQFYEIENIQVWDFGGITQLTGFLEAYRSNPGFETVPAVLIVRDAETDAVAAIASVRNSLQVSGFAVPDKPYELVDGEPAVEIAILPGSETNGRYDNGTLEDLCLATVRNDAMLPIVDQFLEAAEQNMGRELTHRHKSKLHAYLSIKDDFVGMKLGQATRAHAWNLNAPEVGRLRQAFMDIAGCCADRSE